MVIDNNGEYFFLVLRFVINNHEIRFVGIESYVKHFAVLSTTISEFSQLFSKERRGRTRKEPRPISIDNQEVEIVNSFKYILGTIIDQNLTLCDHVDCVCARKLNFFS